MLSELLFEPRGDTGEQKPLSSRDEPQNKRGPLYLTHKQRQIMRVIIRGRDDGLPVNIHELIEMVGYEPTEDSMRFSIRALEKRKFVEKRSAPRNGHRGISYAPTILGMKAYRNNVPGVAG